MRLKKTPAVVCAVMMLSLLLPALPSMARPGYSDQRQLSEKAKSRNQKETISAFQKQVKQYVRVRNRVARRLPHISKDATPEQIEAHKEAFEDAVRKVRPNSKPAQIFSPDIATYIRTKIRSEFKGEDRREIRETILEADTRGVPLRVNYQYPEAKELAEVPATLLLKLPQLPKEVKYRFARKHLLLVDRENGLIVDYMTNALP